MRSLPTLLAVNYKGDVIDKIKSYNSARDTSGCILVGIGRKPDFIQNSALAMDLLMKEIINLGGEKINLIIKNK